MDFPSSMSAGGSIDGMISGVENAIAQLKETRGVVEDATNAVTFVFDARKFSLLD